MRSEDTARLRELEGENARLRAEVERLGQEPRAEPQGDLAAVVDGLRQEADERFRTLIERATDALAVFDSEGRYSFWSPGATEALGWTAEEMHGNRGMELLHPDDVAGSAAVMERLLANPAAAVQVAVRLRHKDGSYRTFDAVYRNLLRVPAIAGIVVNARDVTEQRRLEEQVRESQKLESVGRLAGGVAHDFNNILTVILGCLEGLDAGPGAALEEVAEIRAAAGRARDLTRQLLAFARRQAIAPVALEVGALLRDAERLVARLVGEDVAVSVRSAPGLWRVLGDPGQLQQVVLNLAANARDAMPRGGVFAIEASNVEVGAALTARHSGLAAGPHVLVSFEDSGEGMAPDVRAHVFEPFFTTKAPGRGTGLGLATVYGIVKQSGGHVTVRSEPGRGTRFEVWLPRAPPGAPGAVPRDPTPAPRGGGAEQVLVVEDDPSVREVTVRALRRGGYRVLEAAGGAAALDLAGRTAEPLHLLVTDVVMPGMSGRELAEALSRQRPKLRVLYVSGYSNETITRRGVLEDGIEFLQKPFTPASLLARVRQVLDQL